jgi:hypothetical protein
MSDQSPPPQPQQQPTTIAPTPSATSINDVTVPAASSINDLIQRMDGLAEIMKVMHDQHVELSARMDQTNENMNASLFPPHRTSRGDSPYYPVQGTVPAHRSMSQASNDDDYHSTSSTSHSVKFPLPGKFNGKMDEAMALRNFISHLERYLDAVDIPVNSPKSGAIAAMLLVDVASNWYDQMKKSAGESIRTWNQLKVELIRRFEPVATEQLAFKNLLAVRYHKDIQTLNHEFMKQLQMLSFYGETHTDQWLTHLYLHALGLGGGTNYICTVLRSAMHDGTVKTLNQMMQKALVAEASVGRSSNRTAVPPSNISSAPYRSSSYNGQSQGSWRSSSQSSSGPSRFQRTPTRDPFTTPKPTLNHVSADDDGESSGVLDDDGNEGKFNAEDDLVNEMHDQDSSEAAPETPVITEEAWLHVMNFAAKNLERFPKLTPVELDRRRRNGSCFKCNRVGHYARDCKSGRDDHGVGGAPQSKKF